MESKIEKLVIYYDEILGKDRDVRILDMANKIDEIIDHLNSQAQPEESNFVHTVGTPILESTTTYSQDTPEVFKEFSDKNIRDDIPEGFVEINGKLHKMEDTPEEWEEVNKDIWYMVGGKKYVSINGEKYVRTSDLEQLLDEREREVLEKIKLFDKRLDWYNEHTHKEHTVGEQLIVQNIQSDFINEFKKELVKLNKEEK